MERDRDSSPEEIIACTGADNLMSKHGGALILLMVCFVILDAAKDDDKIVPRFHFAQSRARNSTEPALYLRR
jgi:hypothetical protein